MHNWNPRRTNRKKDRELPWKNNGRQLLKFEEKYTSKFEIQISNEFQEI